MPAVVGTPLREAPMLRGVLVRLAAGSLATALVVCTAAASDVNTAGAGSVKGLVLDEGTSESLHNLGNPAGLSMQETVNTLEEGFTFTSASEKATDADGSVKTDDRSFGLVPWGGRYQGLTCWISGKDVIGASMAMKGMGRKVTSDRPGAEGKDYSILDASLELQYSRKLTENLHFGAKFRPVTGSAKVASASLYTVDEIKYQQVDFNIGMGLRFGSAGGPSFSVGANYQPYNEPSELTEVLGVDPSSIRKFAGTGGSRLTYRFTSATGGENFGEMAPSGSVIGLQGIVEEEGVGQLAVHADRTSAEAENRNTLHTGYVADYVTSGMSQTLSAWRYGMSGWWRADIGNESAVRMAAAVSGGSRTHEVLDYPDSESVVNRAESSPYGVDVGVSLLRRYFTVGTGISLAGERIRNTPTRDQGEAETLTSSVRSFNVGLEGWFSEEWGARAGVSFGSSRRNEEHRGKPAPGEEGNPIVTDTAVSLGGSYRMVETLEADMALVLHGLAQNPEPGNARVKRTRTDFLAAVRYLF